ncbi:hypothetical protein [Polyangium sp. y55x31]|uniref:hypothetical protein n=1 Tax=Polyangium sp. y55x31 TaxID=3042688 RepID=UPI002482FB11|nr:hypothetical protein [Polyangium sp. y55x31]MDI1475079.1 hypothetical protein [Polyangium sp. y55x31]
MRPGVHWQTPVTVTLLSLMTSAAVLATSTSAPASDAPFTCQTFLTNPRNGQTATPADVVITGFSTCNPPQKPSFTDDTGAAIPVDFVVTPTQSGSDFTLTPKAPLAADRTFTVSAFDETVHCVRPPNRITFSTAVNPSVAEVEIVSEPERLVALKVYLSEPVMNPGDLGDGSSLFSVTIDGFDLAGIGTAEHDGTGVSITYKPLASQPAMTQAVHVRLKQGLVFASGETLAEDLDVSFVPSEWPYGWSPAGKIPVGCAPPSSDVGGCSASPTGSGEGGSAIIGVVMMGLLARGRWRRGRR